jgi:polyhydroxybutyrate depolymerase
MFPIRKLVNIRVLLTTVLLSFGFMALPATASTVNPPTGAWKPGDYPSGLTSQNYLGISGVAGQQGLTRQYKVHVPSGYNPNVPTPVVFCLHGLGQNPVMFCVDSTDVDGVGSIVSVSDQEGFILVMPNGYKNSWNAGACCGKAVSMNLDDVSLMRAILAEVSTHLNIDMKRVYSFGLSNGGFMSFRLACDASDMVAAIVSGSGGVGAMNVVGSYSFSGDPNNFVSCNPTHKVPVLAFHGTDDPLVPYSIFQETMPFVANVNGCSSDTQTASFPPSGGDTTCVSYTGCPSGIAVTGCSVQGGGHCWFGSKNCGTGGGLAGFIGKRVVGNNSNFTKETNDVWPFLKNFARE